MQSKLKIEKGISPPPATRPRGQGPSDGFIFDKMKVGDSILFPDSDSANRFAGHCHAHAKNTPCKPLRRKVEGGYRIWKVKRESNGHAA